MKNNFTTLTTMVLLTFCLSSCALMQKLTCNSGSARSQGSNDAAKGLTQQPGLESAKSCEGAEYNPSQYANDYRAGYEEKKNQMCQTSEATKDGQKDGLAATDKIEGKRKYLTCEKLPQYQSVLSAYDRSYQERFCSNERAMTLADNDGKAMANEKSFDVFSGCSNIDSLNKTYKLTYQDAYRKALKIKEEQFIKDTGTTQFAYAQKNLSSICSISTDQSYVTVSVSNPTHEKILLQGNWNYQYFDKSFNKLTQDSGQEALLLTPQSTKSFNKMTLPRDARFCRAEFTPGLN